MNLTTSDTVSGTLLGTNILNNLLLLVNLVGQLLLAAFIAIPKLKKFKLNREGVTMESSSPTKIGAADKFGE